jgi:hypothetical protein
MTHFMFASGPSWPELAACSLQQLESSYKAQLVSFLTAAFMVSADNAPLADVMVNTQTPNRSQTIEIEAQAFAFMNWLSSNKRFQVRTSMSVAGSATMIEMSKSDSGHFSLHKSLRHLAFRPELRPSRYACSCKVLRPTSSVR